MFTDAALKKVINLRKLLGLKGPGNIGVLRMRAQDSSPVEKEEEKVVNTNEPINESERVRTVNKQEIVNIQEIAIKLEELLPKNDFTIALLKEIDGIFTYVRKKVQHEEDFYKIQTELDEANALKKGLQRDVANATAETKKVQIERDNVYSRFRIERDQDKKIIKSLQANLESHSRNKTAEEVKNEMDKATEKTVDKIRNEPKYPKKYV